MKIYGVTIQDQLFGQKKGEHCKLVGMTRDQIVAHMFRENVPAAPKPPMLAVRSRYGNEIEDQQAAAEIRATVASILNEMDDRRVRTEKALSTGRHEPASLYGGLYAVEEVDDNLIERVERPIEDAFIPLNQLPASAKFRDPVPYGRSPATEAAVPAVAKPAVIRRRPDGTRQVLVSTK